MTNEYKIAVLLPTRGRTDALSRSVFSIVNRAVDLDQLQIIFALDNDDNIGLGHFTDVIQPWLNDKDVSYTAVGFESLGYEGLNQYYNRMAAEASADWLFVWNDDAIMETSGWDRIVAKYDGQFRLLKVHTHGEHPYSIFPIVPKAWLEVTGQLSRHQMIDAELSQIAYMIDLMEIVDIHVTHDRADLTGNNEDDTDKKRVRYEGQPGNPMDFHHIGFSQLRLSDSARLSQYMKSKNIDISFWENVKTGKQYPWEKLILNDVNGQMKQFNMRINQSGQVVKFESDDRANIVRQGNV